MARRISSYSNYLQLALIHTIATLCVLQAQEEVAPEEGLEINLIVGGRSLVIPRPYGYVGADGINDQWDQISAAYIPPGNRQLATFTSESDRKILASNGQPDADRHFHLQVIRVFETTDFDETQFTKKKDEIKAEILEAQNSTVNVLNEQLAGGNANIAEKTGIDLAIDEGEHRFLGIFDDSDQSLGFSIDGTVNVNDKTEPIVTSARMVPVSERILIFYAVSLKRNAEDQAWTEDAVTAWSNAAMVANPTEFEDTPAPRIPTLSPNRIAAIAGLLLGLIVWLVIAHKRRAKKRTQSPKR